MSNQDITALSTFAVRPAGTGEYTDLSDVPAGTAGYNDSDVARSRPVPSIAPTLALQLLSVRDGNVNFVVDDNERTHPLFFLRSGQRFDVRIRKEGDGSGKPEVVYSGVATITLNNAEGGGRAFNVSVTATSVARAEQ